jgi:hypothetical protein
MVMRGELRGERYSIVNHFGINPIIGGIPLMDRSSSGIIIFIDGYFDRLFRDCEI